VAQWKSQVQSLFDKFKTDYANDATYSTVLNDANQMETPVYPVGYGLDGLPKDYQLYVDYGQFDSAVSDCGTSTEGTECSAVPSLITTLQSDIDAYS
jgi:hypothetical protein